MAFGSILGSKSRSKKRLEKRLEKMSKKRRKKVTTPIRKAQGLTQAGMYRGGGPLPTSYLREEEAK